MLPRVIRNEAQYREYLSEIENLAPIDPSPESDQGERLALLSILVEAYERERASLPLPNPVDAILFRMEQQGLRQKDLVPYLGSKSRVSEVLSGKRSLTVAMIRALNLGLGIPANALVSETMSNADDENSEPDWKRFPIREMTKRGWLPTDATNSSERLIVEVRRFFDQIGGNGIGYAYFRRTMHIGGEVSNDVYALNAWLARVLVRSREERAKLKSFNEPESQMKYMKSIAQMSSLRNGPRLARDALAQTGIAFVIEPHLPRTKLDGAALLDRDGTPVIGLTLRYDRLDNFWFTLLHELAHVLLHLKHKQEAFVDNTQYEPDGERREMEANQAAQEALIPRAIWRRSDAYRRQSTEAIERLAKELHIHPAIIAGRIRKESNNYRRFAQLVGHGEASAHFEMDEGG